MRVLLFTLSLATLASCSAPIAKEQQEPAVPAPITGPFQNLPLRFDGYYRTDNGPVIRLMRFFPEGNVVLINGTHDMESQLPGFLVSTTKGNATMGLHNVAVNVVGDSLHFTVRPEDGDLDFRGKAMSGSMVRFQRYSHINGDRTVMEYIFYPDPPKGPEPVSK